MYKISLQKLKKNPRERGEKPLVKINHILVPNSLMDTI